MKKKTFIRAIEAIKAQSEHDTEFSKHLGRAFTGAFEANLTPDNHYLFAGIVDILQEETGDIKGRDSWIDFFMWELDFGKDYKHGCATNADGTNIDLSSAGKLYDFLKGEKK